MRQLSARAFSVFGCLMDGPLASITAIQISRSLGVSERTVRYAVNELSTWLAEQNISLKRVPHKGFSFEAQDAARAAELFAELKNSLSSSARNLTTDQRVQAILYSLLMQTCPHSLEEIAQSTGVSRTTAVRDMKQACSWFSERHVTVSHDAKKGWDIVADEAQRRFLLMNLIDASISSSSNTAEDRGSHRTLETPFVPFNEHDLEYVACTLQKNLAERNLAVTDASFLNLATYLTLTQCRVRDNHWLTSSSLEADNENRTFDLLAKQLWETFALGGTSQQAHLEQQMISMLLEASSKTSAESAEKLRPDISERILDIFLTEVSEKVGYDLYLDQECVHGLRAHFAALTVRNRLGLEIKNDMLPEIQTRFSNLFALCKDVLRNIQLAYGLTATDDETGFLVLYLAAILEKAQPAPSGSRTIRVALVCGAGIGTVAYLSRSLAKEFPRLEICAKLPAREIESFDFQNIDLVLTTVSLDVVITRPVIRVTPTLTKNDVRNIESFLRPLQPIVPKSS